MTPPEILKKHWGYDAFRPMQSDIIQSVLDGTDTLALLPTGGGKSLCFQVPALCKEGVCLVISPLIALMKDQVENLKKRDIAAAAIYSGMHYKDIDRLLDNAAYGGLKFLYMSPERLTTTLARERIKKMNVNLLAVDEAHCISQWGYDFRPPYLDIAAIREWLPDTPILALTATATPEVKTDICEKLEFKRGFQIFEKDFSRPNLSYIVRHIETKEPKLYEILSKTRGAAIVYVRNRKRAKDLVQYLQQRGLAADFYHAGLTPAERSSRQDAWMKDNPRIMIATNAFGMGIDKPNVRTVVHVDLPDSLEAYFQEAGRAGRDEQKSYAVLLVNKADAPTLRAQFEANFPEMREIRRVYQALGSYLQLAVGGGEGESFDFDFGDFTERFKFEALKTYTCFRILEQDGWLTLSEAVMQPPRIMVLVDRESLYDYQLRNPATERVLKGILRALPNVMSDFATFSETQIAQFLKMSAVEMVAIFHKFHNDGLIDFRPRKEKPQLTLLRERMDAQYLTIDWTLYMFRKKRAEARLNKSIEYAELDICRSQQLLNYFGQTNAAPCGVCDVCVEGEKRTLETEEYESLSAKIRALLNRETLTLKEIVDSFSEKQRTKVIQTIGYMLEERHLAKENDKIKVVESDR
ncbi:MAG: RecQ family ATP-dependent DNA helicase [Saprospiraceae bacterium]|nr:RecQ family ATP-dependent DNA helicase [Saprospiraceae bacterium]